MKALIITGGEFNKNFAVSFLQNKHYDYIIAVDGGIEYAKQLGIMPNMLVGDFDTYDSDDIESYEARGVVVRQFKPEKDDTDTEIAVREAVRLGCDADIICGLGGRVDHLLANIHVMKIGIDSGLSVRMVDGKNIITIKDKPFTLNKKEYNKKYISFIPFSGEVCNLKLKGFKYNLDGYTLKPGSSRCVSNEMEDVLAYVSFDSGCLIVVNSSDIESE